MFLSSVYPRSRRPCLNASKCGWFREPIKRIPTRGTFFVCCASASWTDTRVKVTSTAAMALYRIRALLLLLVAYCPAKPSMLVPKAAPLLPRFPLQTAKLFHACEWVTRQGKTVTLLDYLSVQQCAIV